MHNVESKAQIHNLKIKLTNLKTNIIQQADALDDVIMSLSELEDCVIDLLSTEKDVL